MTSVSAFPTPMATGKKFTIERETMKNPTVFKHIKP